MNDVDMDAKKNKLSKKSISIMVFSLIAVVITGTYAWLTYRSNKTALVLTVGSMDGMSLTLKPYQITASLTPTNDYTTEEYVNVTANNKKTKAEIFNLYYDVTSIDSELIDDGFKYTIVKSTDSWSNQTVVKTGDFSGAVAGENMDIYTETVPGNNTTYEYRVYLWIDSTDGNQANMQGKAFTGELRAEIEEYICNEPVTAPYLDTGMIPVTIGDNGDVTTVSQNDPSWYSYCDKKWANAVLVKETADNETDSHDRSYYKTNSTNGTNVTVTDSDILAYFVWIPRYSYKVWQYEGVSDTGQEQTIDIKFVDTNTNETATQNGEYYTHPAFTFGTQSLAGIWVGKFETSVDTSSACYITPNTTNCNSIQSEPRILPNVDSLRYQVPCNEFQTALKFAGGIMTNNVVSFSGSSTYGLTATVDSHMMKNSEWGAVAYLLHSKYGINTEVRKNNFKESKSNYLRTFTGCGANSANANTTTTVTTCAIPYGTVSGETFDYPQSTTGNISGVFDMSAGAKESIMANYGNTPGDSGFVASWFAESSNSKYYNLYDSTIFTGDQNNNTTFCTLSTCGGHALNETKSWYNDSNIFVASAGPWTMRGGSHGDTASSGAFNYVWFSGYAGSSNSFRTVLVNVGS